MSKRVLLYGDSNTYGYRWGDDFRFPKGERWPDIAQELVGDKFELINEGMNGRTATCVGNIPPFVDGPDGIEDCVLSNMPLDLICVMLGTNDLQKEFCLSAVKIAHNCGQILIKAKEVMNKVKPENHCKYLLIAPIEMTKDVANSVWVEDYLGDVTIGITKEFASCYAKVAKEQGFLFFDAAPHGKACIEDGMHLSEESQRTLGQAFGEYLLDLEANGQI